MIEISMDDALKSLEWAVAQRGEGFVYKAPVSENGCVYVHGDRQYNPNTGEYTLENQTPGCMVGMALNHLGVDLQVFIDKEVNADNDVADLQRKLNGDVFNMSWEAREVFRVAQQEQDLGMTWADALDAAKGRYAGIKGNQNDS